MTIIRHDFQKKQSTSASQDKDKKIPGYQLRIDLGFSSPLIWRTVRVPGKITLGEFHNVIQKCFGWHDEATHRFLVGKIFYNPPSAIMSDNDFCEDDYQLHELEEGMGFIFTYLYEGGSGWECEITLEEKIYDGDTIPCPELVAGERAFPGEMFDDIHDYQETLQLLETSDQRSSTLARHNLPSDFDPSNCEIDAINSLLSTSANI